MAKKLSDPIEREKIRKNNHDKWMRRYKRCGLVNKHKWMDKFGNTIRHTGLKLKTRGYDMKGKQAHHWNYNEPNCVFLLTPEAHRAIHRYTKVNHEDGYCYLKKDNTKIETLEQAQKVFADILQECGIKQELEVVSF